MDSDKRHYSQGHTRGKAMDLLYSAKWQTPAYVFSENELMENLNRAKKIATENDINFLYALKPLDYASVMKKMVGIVDGFAASSVFEARLAREILGDTGSIHYVTPGLRDSELEELLQYCQYITVNSAAQWHRIAPLLKGKVKLGVRINPRLSVVDDERYDPCAEDSRLGLQIPEFLFHIKKYPELLDTISGIHMHTNCEGEDFKDLRSTIEKISKGIGHYLDKLEWFNIGGGYYFKEAQNYDDFKAAMTLLKEHHNLDVFMEPGGTIVRSAGNVVSTVIDIIGPKDAKVAVLDTSVNHMPEVYEYQYEPNIFGAYDTEKDEEGLELEELHEYMLAGASCLAGDQFGSYYFKEPLKIGQRVIFINMGSYTLVKAHMFNGINLPSIYFVDMDDNVQLERKFTYEDFLLHVTPASAK